MKKTRVLFVVLQLDAGGSERVVFELARSLDPGQFEIYVAAFKGGVLEKPLREYCKQIFFINKGKGFDISSMVQLAKIIRENRIDVVNSHHYMPCLYSFPGSKILNRTKLVYTEHSVPEVEGIATSMHGKFFYCMLFKIDAVVGVSREITAKFKECYPRHTDKFLAILNGVDLGRFSRREKRDEIRSQWGLAPNHFVVGTVANFRKVKNHACLIRAAARLKGSHPQLRLLFVGTGFPGDSENSEEEVRTLIGELGLHDRVILAGYQESIPEMLSAFDAFCLPSFSEGLPVSLLEAMAAGVPVVGSEVRGITELVSSRQTGLLFSPGNDLALSQALEEILENRKIGVELAENAYVNVAQMYSSKEWIRKISCIFDGKY